MDKYGYQPNKNDEKIKTAVLKGTCPICGEPISGNPPICPEHGSAPFEKTDGQEKRS
jgi:hypothetical protein